MTPTTRRSPDCGLRQLLFVLFSAQPGVGCGGGAMEEQRRMRNYLRRMEREGVQRVKMFLVITAAYLLFWGPLFVVTLVHHPALGTQLGYEVRHCAI